MSKELNYKKSWLKILQNILIVLAIGWSGFPNTMWIVIFPYGLIPFFGVVFATYILNILFFKVAKKRYDEGKINLAYTITIAASLVYIFVNLSACVWIGNTIHLH